MLALVFCSLYNTETHNVVYKVSQSIPNDFFPLRLFILLLQFYQCSICILFVGRLNHLGFDWICIFRISNNSQNRDHYSLRAFQSRLIKSDPNRFESIDFLIKISSNETIQNFTTSPIVCRFDNQHRTSNIEHFYIHIHLMRIAFGKHY